MHLLWLRSKGAALAAGLLAFSLVAGAAPTGAAPFDGTRAQQRLGQRVSATLERGGNLGLRPELALPETEIVQFNSVTGHNIPRVFWEFLGQAGPIWNGRVTRGPVVDWLFAMGLPITDAYWTRALPAEPGRERLQRQLLAR